MSGQNCQHSVRQPLEGPPGWYRCSACGVWGREPLPSAEELNAVYAAAYQGSRLPALAMHATNADLARQFLDLIERLVSWRTWNGAAILEYGAGEGDLAAELAARGANVAAVDPYGFEVCKARRLSAFRSLEELPEGACFDGIVMTEVAEHMPSPWETFSRLHALLKKGGWLFVTTPNNGSLRARLFRARWSECAKPGHLFLFSRRALLQALRQTGYGKAIAVREGVRFSKGLVRSGLQQLLHIAAWDGQLRCIAWK